MPRDPIDAVTGDLLVRQIDGWLAGALHRSRRATLALAYGGPDAGRADAALRVVAEHADRVRGRRLTVLVLAGAGSADDLPARLGAVDAALPRDVAIHLVPGGPDRLPVALKAAGAAGAPVLAWLDDPTAPTPDASTLGALTAGRATEVLLAAAPGQGAREALVAAGFPLAAEVELVPADGSPARLLAIGTGSDRSLEGFKDALWAVAAPGVGYREPADASGTPFAPTAAAPDLTALGRSIRAELGRSGPRTVTELRRHALTATVHRSADALTVLAGLLDSGVVARDPVDGRLAGDVLIRAVPSGAGSAA